MKLHTHLLGLLALSACLASSLSSSIAAAATLRFGVLSHAQDLSAELVEHNGENLAFIMVGGLKTRREACDRDLYLQRKNALDSSEHGVISSLTASDWAWCPGSASLNQLRELLFDSNFSLGSSKLPMTRLSANRKFHRYTENARWELHGILFATVHLPTNNNNYLPEAGRNGEFEDRLVANRIWLQRLFALAQQKKIRHIVLFSDGNVWQPRAKIKRDGFIEIRNQISQLSGKLDGKLLLIDQSPEQSSNTIQWRGNIGHISLTPGWHQFKANSNLASPFALEKK
jgi:hypothetical protein